MPNTASYMFRVWNKTKIISSRAVVGYLLPAVLRATRSPIVFETTRLILNIQTAFNSPTGETNLCLNVNDLVAADNVTGKVRGVATHFWLGGGTHFSGLFRVGSVE